MNLYFELSKGFADVSYNGRQHWVIFDEEKYPNLIMNMSERVWEETETKVRFVKHRWLADPIVDMKEFVWIKLKSKEL